MKPAVSGLISSSREWKFFELSAFEKVITGERNLGPLNLRCLPHSEEYPPRSLISGGPGTGKSSIVTELCKRWYNGDLLGEYEYVILLQADDPRVKNATKIIDLAPEGHKEWFDPIIKANGANTLFIIDGYDEFSDESRKRNGLFDLIIRQGKGLSEVSLIVTARPWCAKQISSHFANQVEVLGFTPASREQYIRYQLNASDFDEFIIQKPLEECTAIPFLLAMLVKIFKEVKTHSKKVKARDKAKKLHTECFPKTQTKIYGSLVRALVLEYVYNREHLSKFLPENIEVVPGEFSSLPRSIYIPFMAVCIHAYHSLTSSTCNCSISETFDLLTKHEIQTSSEKSVSYNFLHSTIQEYLAAYCISCLEQSEMEKCIKEIKKNHRYFLILEFLHGFNCVKIQATADNIQCYTNVQNFSVFRQLCEFEAHSSVIQSLYHNVAETAAGPCEVGRSWPIPSPGDFWCLGRVIALSGCTWELGFTLRPIRSDHLMMLQRGMESVNAEQPESCHGRIRKLGLSLTNIDDLGFLANKSCSFIERIQLFENHFTSAVIPSMCISLPNLSRLSKFLFHHNDISPGDHKRLILALAENCKNLKHVTFTDLQSDECQILLQELKSLKTLELWRISTSTCKSVFNSIYESKSALEELEIHQSEVTYESIKHLPKVLPESQIKVLKLNNCRINCQCVSIIAVAVSYPSCSLELLNLCDNAIEDDGGRKLLKLQHIDLGDTHKFNKFSTKIIEALEAIKEKQRD